MPRVSGLNKYEREFLRAIRSGSPSVPRRFAVPPFEDSAWIYVGQKCIASLLCISPRRLRDYRATSALFQRFVFVDEATGRWSLNMETGGFHELMLAVQERRCSRRRRSAARAFNGRFDLHRRPPSDDDREEFERKRREQERRERIQDNPNKPDKQHDEGSDDLGPVTEDR